MCIKFLTVSYGLKLIIYFLILTHMLKCSQADKSDTRTDGWTASIQNMELFIVIKPKIDQKLLQ